jgi:16S rRNA (guanine527-N7)-methyltransferase
MIDDGREWLVTRFGEQAATSVERFLAMVVEENDRQNLISPASVDSIWTRHAVDSAQLVDLAPAQGTWVDIGTGGGFPGIIVAICRPEPMLLVEPRKRRAEFLAHAVSTLGIDHVTVAAQKIEQVTASAAVISARAVAAVEKLLQASAHCATPETRWILPRGRIDPADLDRWRSGQRGMVFHVEHSLTDPGSSILIAGRRR